jgi:hypothetical protein
MTTTHARKDTGAPYARPGPKPRMSKNAEIFHPFADQTLRLARALRSTGLSKSEYFRRALDVALETDGQGRELVIDSRGDESIIII